MARADVITAGVAAIQTAEIQALSDQLGLAYDSGISDQKAVDGSTGTFTQNDIDNAVAAAQAVDAVTLATAQKQSAAALATLQASLDAETAKETSDTALIASLQSSVASVQSSIAALAALFPTS